MKRAILIVLLTAVVTAVVTFSATRYLIDREVTDPKVIVGSLHSEILFEDREFLVHLPESYSSEPEKRYPVLYVLDGSQHTHTAESAALMARIGVMPEVLVVGIPNVGAEGRQRDYTPPGMRQDVEETGSAKGRADSFLAFLKSELIPRIEREYRADGTRMLSGHSRGGLMVVYTLMAEPSLFQARFAHSPALWRDDDAIIDQLESFLANTPELNSFVYLSLGDQENEKMTKSFRRAVALLEAQVPRALRWRADFTRMANHNTNVRSATPVGLHAFFAPEGTDGLQAESGTSR